VRVAGEREGGEGGVGCVPGFDGGEAGVEVFGAEEAGGGVGREGDGFGRKRGGTEVVFVDCEGGVVEVEL
jgi:hypothetical protein